MAAPPTTTRSREMLNRAEAGNVIACLDGMGSIFCTQTGRQGCSYPPDGEDDDARGRLRFLRHVRGGRTRGKERQSLHGRFRLLFQFLHFGVQLGELKLHFFDVRCGLNARQRSEIARVDGSGSDFRNGSHLDTGISF